MRLSPSPSSPACLPRRLNPLPAPKRRAPRPPALPTAAPEVGTRGAREREPGATPAPTPCWSGRLPPRARSEAAESRCGCAAGALESGQRAVGGGLRAPGRSDSATGFRYNSRMNLSLAASRMQGGGARMPTTTSCWAVALS